MKIHSLRSSSGNRMSWVRASVSWEKTLMKSNFIPFFQFLKNQTETQTEKEIPAVRQYLQEELVNQRPANNLRRWRIN